MNFNWPVNRPIDWLIDNIHSCTANTIVSVVKTELAKGTDEYLETCVVLTFLALGWYIVQRLSMLTNGVVEMNVLYK